MCSLIARGRYPYVIQLYMNEDEETAMENRERVIRNSEHQLYTYEWEFCLNYEHFTVEQLSSLFFIFCGTFCQLYCIPLRICDDTYIKIALTGYPQPPQKIVSCYYSVSLVTNDGHDQFTEEGRIRSSDKIMDTFISSNFRVRELQNKPFTIRFSWCEDEDDNSQHCEDKDLDDSQKGMSRSTNGIECATQTEDVQFLDSRNIRSNTEIPANIIERSTQTEPASSAGDISTDKKNETFKFLEILSNDLGSFYESKVDPDCVLKVDETEFHAHRSVLAARSTVFGAMFHHDTSECRSGKVDIIDVDAASLSDVLYYIYTGKICELSPDTVTTMYVVADKYALVDFRDKCLDFLMCNLTVDNIGDAALLAHTHAEMKLEDKVTEFIEERLDDLGENERWKIFSDTHSKLANKLLFSALISSKKKLAK